MSCDAAWDAKLNETTSPALLEDATPDGLVDLGMMTHPRDSRQLLIGRLHKLERMGLVRTNAPKQWLPAANMERTVRHLGEDADIREAMRHRIAERGLSRQRFAIHRDPEAAMRVLSDDSLRSASIGQN